MIEARRGIFRGTDLNDISINDGNSFPGYIISNSIIGFLIICILCTGILTVLIWPLFWRWLWDQKFVLLSILIPILITSIIEGYLIDYIYHDKYIKHRGGAGIIDFVYFFLAILEGIGAALERLLYGVVVLCLC